jgi:hypothetical protein
MTRVLAWLSIAGGEKGFMKNLLGCEMQFFTVRGMWRSLIIRVAIAALGWPAGVALAFAIYSPQGSSDDLLPFEVVLDATTSNIYGMTCSGGDVGPCPASHATCIRPQVLGLVRSPL